MLAALCIGASTPACAALADASFDSGGGFGGADGVTTATGATSGAFGAGGSDQGGSIQIGPDGGVVDPPQPFASLCGGDDCEIGEECGAGGASGAGGAGGSPGPMTCSLVPVEAGAAAQCTPAGSFDEGEPCTSADNCKAGLGCAATPNGGVCRSYCCGDVELCPANTYCDPQPMAEDTIHMQPTLIPVCMPAMNCQLLNDAMTCPPPLTCTIVRADGTTSCVAPGQGLLNEPCPCAAGYVCSKLKNECKKLCHIGQDAVDCEGNGTCLGAGMGFPEGFGICSPASN